MQQCGHELLNLQRQTENTAALNKHRVQRLRYLMLAFKNAAMVTKGRRWPRLQGLKEQRMVREGFGIFEDGGPSSENQVKKSLSE